MRMLAVAWLVSWGSPAPLGGQEAEGDHLPLLIVLPLPGIVVPEAVVRQPLVDVAALLGPLFWKPRMASPNMSTWTWLRLQAGLGVVVACPSRGRETPRAVSSSLTAFRKGNTRPMPDRPPTDRRSPSPPPG